MKNTRTIRIAAADLEELNSTVRALNSLHGSQTCHISRHITRLENITARMNPAPKRAARVRMLKSATV